MVLCGLLPDEIHNLITDHPTYRADQIFSWIQNHRKNFNEMKNLPQKLLQQLSEKHSCFSLTVESVNKADDGTTKFSFRLRDENVIEAVVLMDSEGRKTACISSQAGCGMGCAFCMTGKLGLARSLDSSEIVEQYLQATEECGDISNIVFMGMGEPLANYDAVAKSIQIFQHPKGIHISNRKITLSTCGLAPEIKKLADEKIPVKLAVSLISARETKRTELMPVNKAFNIQTLKESIQYYQDVTKKRITLEIVLIDGETDSDEDLNELLAFCRDINAFVNIIPWNSIELLPFKAASKGRTTHFLKVLERNGIAASLRRSKGQKVSGACGQLGKVKI